MIVCLRSVHIPAEVRDRYVDWIGEGRVIRQAHSVVGGYLNLTALQQPEPSPKGASMKWVTRARPKTDRIACPWLIRRFIDPDAEIVYVPKDAVHAYTREHNGHSFDAPGAEFDHRDGKCTFEVLIDHYGLGGDPALLRLAAIVHAADIDDDLDTDPLGPGLLAIGLGGLDVETDDHQLLDRASFVYDALYAWSAQQVTSA